MLNLLVSRGLFIGLIAVVVIVVGVCIGLAVMLFIKPVRVKETVEAEAIRKELYRRETELVIKLVTEKAEGKNREDLLAVLRRIKSVEMLVDDIIRNEKAERGIVDKPAPEAKRPAGKPAARKPAESKKAPAESVAVNVAPAEVVATTAAEETPQEEKPAAKPARKKKKRNEFEPSED